MLYFCNYVLRELSVHGRQLLRPFSLDRTVQMKPQLILDAPALLDDFYLNLIAWSVRQVMAVALLHEVYLWKEADRSVTKLVSLQESTKDYWSSLAWMEDVKGAIFSDPD